jgi:hypothetical protein
MAIEAPAYTRANVLTGLASGYYQVYNPSVPPVLPARTTALNSAWSSPWTSIGATAGGLDFNFQRSLTPIMIEEQSVAISQVTKTSTFSFSVELSEDTFKTMQLAYGGGTITTVAAGSGTVGYETLVPSAEVVQYSFGFEAMNEYGFPRRVLVPIVIANAQVKTQYNRSTKQRTYSITLESLVPIEQCTFENVKAVALP